MTTLFLAWQAPTPSRAWFPVGRLDADKDRDNFVFQYTRGALEAEKKVGFKPLVAFPDFKNRYESGKLFPLFQNRVLDPNRKNFAEYLASLDLDPGHADPIEILGITGGERQTDSLEVFPKIEKKKDGSFSCRFFLHGFRHMSEKARERVMALESGQQLGVSLEMTNPAARVAIQLTTDDYQFIGWAPRYLVDDLLSAIAATPQISARVVRVNGHDVPANRRVLVEMRGKLPADFEPMSSQQFEPISNEKNSLRLANDLGAGAEIL